MIIHCGDCGAEYDGAGGVSFCPHIETALDRVQEFCEGWGFEHGPDAHPVVLEGLNHLALAYGEAHPERCLGFALDSPASKVFIE